MKFFCSLRCLLCLCLLCLTVCLASCNASSNPDITTDRSETENSTSTESEIDWAPLSEVYGIPLEPDKTDLPSYDALKGITRGMTREEVFSLIGNPQRITVWIMSSSPGKSSARETACFVYDSSDGDSLVVLWGFMGTLDSDPVVLNLNMAPGNSQ